MKRVLTYTILLIVTLSAAAQEHSVLARGAWWKMGAKQTGVYRLTVTDVPALQGVSVDSLGVYGAGKGMLSTSNSLTSTADLQPVGIDIIDRNGNGLFDSGDELLFYGEGAEGWQYATSDGRWEYAHHAYATENYYYLTTSAPQQRRIVPAAAVTATETVTTYTAVAHIDNDLVNIFESGQQWMGEKFSSALPTRTFTLGVAGNSDGSVLVRYALANKSKTAASFSVSTSGYANQTPVAMYTTVNDSFTTTATSFTFTLTFTPGESNAAGYLDFIELNSHAPLTFGSGQMLIRNDQALHGTARFSMSGNTTGVRVWDVSHAGREREMTMAAGAWSDSTDVARCYVAFDGSNYLSPSSINTLGNQDLHGSEAADLVVVSTPTLLAQAQRVAALHEIFDGMATLVVTDRQVYNEFSSGKQDPMAIRSLLRSLKAAHPERAPRYLLLMGKGTYDNRNLLGYDYPTLVTYETAYMDSYSYDEYGWAYCSDIILGYLDIASPGSSGTLNVGVGRLPAKTAEEAAHMVDKIEGYLTRRDLLAMDGRGDWRNYVALLADDADPGHPHDTGFVHSSEVVANNIQQRFPHINIDKFYADAYHQSSGAIGSYYPDLNNALRLRMNNGCLLLNYIGHGSTGYIGTERYIEFSDIEAYTNQDRLPLFVTSTCTYGRFDIVEGRCGAETFLLAPAGAMAVISASRPISHTESFNNDVVIEAINPNNTIGDALRIAKNKTAVSQSIGLIGDPALRLSQPENRVVVTHINRRPVSSGVDDSATVLSRVIVSGEIQDTSGQLLTDFEGTIYPIVFDRVVNTSTLANDNPGTEVSFTQQKNILYRGSHPVERGKFEYSFIVPKDVAYQYGYAKLSHYAKSASDHASGCYHQLLLGGLNDSADSAAAAPTIRLFMGDTNFRSDGLTDANPTMIAYLRDSAGINAGAGLGHDITAMLDGNPGTLVVLNDLYQPDVEQGGGGTVTYRFSNLTTGTHTLTLKAWNIFNISSSATITFTVNNPDTLSLSQLHCWPNPASGRTQFMLEVNNTAKIASAELQIFNSHGQLVVSHRPVVSTDGYVVGPVGWDLSAIPAGMYLARMIVTDTDGTVYQQTTKCIVR